jgi:hypothetical protein
MIDGYVVEGHVPTDVLEQFLAEKPDAIGLAVPGMPIGSPGMEGANPQSYSVVAFNDAGETWIYANVTP